MRKALYVFSVARVSGADSRLRLTILQAVLLHPIVFTLWYWSKVIGKGLAITRVRALTPTAGERRVAQDVISWNLKLRHNVSRARMERLIQLCRVLFNGDPGRVNVLVVGPRNEAELLLLRAYGFRRRNIRAIDLMSTSTAIELMDMHQMTFPSDSFDLVLANYVLSYSDDRPRACAEYVRVLKPGGLIGLSFKSTNTPHIEGLEPIRGGLNELYSLFGDSIEHVYWQEQRQSDCCALFRICKSDTSVRDRGAEVSPFGLEKVN